METLLKIMPRWSNNLAYAIGLIATDGNLSNDGRHIVFVSKDLQLIKTFNRCLKIKPKICLKKSGFAPEKKYYFIQFSNVNLYNFFKKVGLTPAKTKTLGRLSVPKHFFPDLIRGLFDGDGTFYSYWDKRWRSSFLFYLGFCSASQKHIKWLREEIWRSFKIKGYVNQQLHGGTYQLRYAKREARIIIDKMYYSQNVPCLKRKLLKLKSALTKNDKS